MMNTGSRQVPGENGGAQVLMGGAQVTTKNGYMTGALHVPNQAISGNLGRGIYSDENVAINTGSGKVAREITGGHIFMEGGELTHTTGFVTGHFARGVYGKGNVIRNTGSCQQGGETGVGQIFMEGRQVTSTNGYVTGALYVPNQEPSGDLANMVYHIGNVVTNIGSRQVGEHVGGGRIFMEGRQVTPTNGCVTGALHVPNQEASGDLVREIYSNENVLRNTGSGQVAEEIAGAQIFKEADYQNTGQGIATNPSDIAEKQLTDDDIDELLRELHED